MKKTFKIMILTLIMAIFLIGGSVVPVNIVLAAENTTPIAIGLYDAEANESLGYEVKDYQHGITKFYAPKVDGYQVVSENPIILEVDETCSGYLVEFLYVKEGRQYGTIEVRHEDVDGNIIAVTETEYRYFGDTSTIDAQPISGYEIVGTNKYNVTLSEFNPTETITFFYTEGVATTSATVTVKYLELGSDKPIVNDVVEEAEIMTTYEAVPVEVKDYTFLLGTSDNLQVDVMDTTPVTIILYYEYLGETTELIPDINDNTQVNDIPTATATASAVLINGGKTSFDAYNINGNNYFKLRDLAYVLTDSEKQFSVGYDVDKNAIMLTSNEKYTPVGGELNKGNEEINSISSTSSMIFKDGEQINLGAYNINGNNYFKLRDIATMFDFNVGWDNDTNTITVNTNETYVMP